MNSKKDTWYSMKSDRFPDRLRKCFDGEVGKCGRHVSREEFSEATGIKDSAIRNYLSGQNGMKVDDLIKTADFFGVTVGYLVGHENVSLPDLQLRSTSQYSGLSEHSIEALHYMNEMCKNAPSQYRRKATEAISFLNRVLENEWTSIDRNRSITQKYYPKKPEKEYALVYRITFFFALLEEYVIGSGKAGYYAFKRDEDEDFTTFIPTDEIFRNVIHDEIEEYLDSMSEEIMTVKITSYKIGALEWIRKRYTDSIDSGEEFTASDFNDAIAEYLEDANAEEGTDIEPGMLSLEFEKLDDYIKEVESWQALH